MYHSIQLIPDSKQLYNSNNKLNGRNTWSAWHLIPSSRPVFIPPAFKSNYIDIPGGNGTIDVSTILSGYPVYNDRESSVEFYVMNGYKEWQVAYSDIMDYVHGQKMKVILEDDPAYYYRGRVTVNEWKSEKDWSKIVLDFHLEPYKYDLFDSSERWRWDPFSFVDGIIRNTAQNAGDPNPLYENLTFTGAGDGVANVAKKLVIPSRSMPVIPEFTVKANTANSWIKIAKLNAAETSITASRQITLADTGAHTYSIYSIRLTEGDNHIGFLGESGKSFTVSVKFGGGRL